jgi:hypothetical protein
MDEELEEVKVVKEVIEILKNNKKDSLELTLEKVNQIKDLLDQARNQLGDKLSTLYFEQFKGIAENIAEATKNRVSHLGDSIIKQSSDISNQTNTLISSTLKTLKELNTWVSSALKSNNHNLEQQQEITDLNASISSFAIMEETNKTVVSNHTSKSYEMMIEKEPSKTVSNSLKSYEMMKSDQKNSLVDIDLSISNDKDSRGSETTSILQQILGLCKNLQDNLNIKHKPRSKSTQR